MKISQLRWSTRVSFQILFFGILALAILYLFGFGYVRILKGAGDDVSKTLVTAFFSLLGSILLVVVGKIVERRMTVEAEIRKQKKPVYEEFLKTLFDAGFNNYKGELNSEQRKIFDDFSHKLILWGSPEMIQVWGDWRALSERGSSPSLREQQEIMARIFKGIRADIGNSVAGVTGRDLLRLLWKQDVIKI